ncbi:hypothetical protein [Paraburkholderia sp. 32]|uniref:hypothetical protein n=1 Tax=Paraburkholderia sp. 32 TaxID=2991057 RepID=UPI003D234917
MIDQIGIFIFGVVAVYLSQDGRLSHRKYASVFGLLGQPAWLFASWQAHLWGFFAVSVVYTLVWSRGFYAHWLSRPT